MHCKSLWIKASAKCINVNVPNVYYKEKIYSFYDIICRYYKKKSVVLTRKHLVIMRKDVDLTRKHLVITRKYVVLSRKYLIKMRIKNVKWVMDVISLWF